ncbi:MAG: bifunctional precorrin-2 dehydrogenase/sirohydrochlorin ferrochelatase [Candidatus Bathyarchaeia archaeon]
MIIDFKFDGKYVVIIGGGEEAYRKVLSFLDAGAKILLVSRSFKDDIKKLHQEKKISLLKVDIKDGEAFFNQLNPKPDVLAIATSDQKLNTQLSKLAHSAGCMVYVADNPAISDFILPAIAKIGDVRIAVSTGGKSPAMAKILRDKVEKLITKEDLLQIKLQAHMRTLLKQQIADQKLRKKILYKILEDEHVKELLSDGKFDEAQRVAQEIAENVQVWQEVQL